MVKWAKNLFWGVTLHKLHFGHFAWVNMQKWFCLVYSARIEVLKFMHIQAAETIFLLTCRPTLKRTWTVWSAASAWCSNNKDCKGLKYHDRLCCTESFPCFHLVHCLHIASMCFSTRKSKPAIYVLVSNRSLNILVTLEIKARYECQLSSNKWSFFIHTKVEPSHD